MRIIVPIISNTKLFMQKPSLWIKANNGLSTLNYSDLITFSIHIIEI